MRILFIGDIFGRPGREGLRLALPELIESHQPDFVVVNGENSAGGKGITGKIVDEILTLGVDCISGGNHSLHQRDSDALHNEEQRLLRPANFPPGTPGRGFGVFQHRSGTGASLAVVNLCGRAFMNNYDDPFRMASELVALAKETTPFVLVDFHAETTSEKVAMGWYLDGQATAVVGTHTHIPTADENVLPQGTAYITDVGMSGPYRSIIGAEIDAVLSTIITLRPSRFGVSEDGDVRVCGVVIDADDTTGLATRIERVRVNLGDI